MRKSIGVVGLLVGACSWVTVRPSTRTAPTRCTSTQAAPVIDAAVAIAWTGLAIATLIVPCDAGNCDLRWASAAELGLFALPFGLSSRYGFRHTSACQRALAGQSPPVNAERERCLAQRSKQYGELGAHEGPERVRAAQGLPSCPAYTEGEQRAEQIWETTRSAVVAAVQGDCGTVDRIALELEHMAPDHYARVVMWQPDISACLATRANREDQCRAERARRQREAQEITDTTQRAEALQQLPECPASK